MVAFRGIYHRLSRLAKSAAPKHFWKHEKWCAMEGNKIQAVSDGELNMSARGCGGSSSSLPGAQGREAGPNNGVLSWAVSFERLLEDPWGVHYFTSFLRSEVSAENILFWQACEKFRKIPATSLDELTAEARSIYDTYLADSAPYSVNIDDTAKTEEKDLEQPMSNMFNKAQAQIFKLMKMDSYRRFVRSPLYQRCTMASVDGKGLPQPFLLESWGDVAKRSPSLFDTKDKILDVASEKRHQKSGSLGDHGFVPRKELLVMSSSNFELGSLYRQIENDRSSPCSLEQDGGDGGGGLIGVEEGYCCIYLPDGSASLLPTRCGQMIKDMLASLCEKRGFPLKDVVIYLHGKDKQPLSLDQDCSILRHQQVSLEVRVTFALEIAFTGKTMGIKVKSSKTLQEALSAVLQRHHLKQQEALVTIVGRDEPLNMTGTVFRLANKTLRLDKTKDCSVLSVAERQTYHEKAKEEDEKRERERGRGVSRVGAAAVATQAGPVSAGGLQPRSLQQTNSTRIWPRPGNRDIDGVFLDMLTRAQCYRVDDQRGLLTKEQLEIPMFLQLASDPGQDTELDEARTTSSSTADCKEGKGCKGDEMRSAGVVEEKTPTQSEPRDLREKAV